MVRIRVLGPIEVVGADGRPASVEGRRPSLLLALLAGLAPHVVSSDRLADALWGDEQPENPPAALQSQITRLRRRLPDLSFIETVADGYRLAAVDEVDWVVFERLVEEAASAPPSGALTRLEAAIGMWRGTPFGAAGEHELLHPVTARLEERRVTASENEVAALLALGRHADAVARAHALTIEQPLREAPVLLQMRSLAAAGRDAEALDAATAFRRTLRDELGLEPSPRLHDLEAGILRHETLGPSSTLRETGGAGVGPPLPDFATSFVGRDDDVSALRSLVTTARLVCVVGPGGVGKTRLAVEAARGLPRMTFPDGTWFVDLTPVRVPSDVADAFAATLGVERQSDSPILDRLVEALATRRLLLIVDNCEHVLDSVAEVLDVLVGRTTAVTVLATSRERLALAAERCFPLAPLGLPDADHAVGAAVVLFVDRARAAFPAFTLDGAERAVCELCRSVDGLPLAIELTATRLTTRSAGEVLGDLGARLKAAPVRRGRLDRHRSMHAVVAWSHDLLDPADQLLFAQLSVCTGGFTVDAAAAVAEVDVEDAAQRVSALVDRSLVAIDSRGVTTRYRLLEPIRDFAARCLDAEGDGDAARDRHAAWFAELVAAAGAGLRGVDEATWMGVLDVELANMRTAFRHLAEAGDREGCLRLLEPLYEYVWCGAGSEIGLWAEETVERFGGPHPRFGAVCAVAGVAAWHRGDPQRAGNLGAQGVDRSRDRRDARLSIEVLGDVAAANGGFDDAIRHYEETVAIARTGDDTRRLVVGLCNVALARAYANDVTGAHPLTDEALALAQRTRNPTNLAFAAYTAGEIRAETAPRDALPFLERAVELSQAARNRFVAGIAGLTQVSVAARLGDPRAALATYPPLLDHWQRLGAWMQQWTTIRTLVETLVRAGSIEPATVLLGALQSSPRAAPLVGADAQRLGVAAEVMRRSLGERRYAELMEHGAHLGDDEAIDFARATLAGGATAGGTVDTVMPDSG